MARLFIALDIDRGAIDRLHPAIDFLSSHASFLKTVEPENHHITLKFLGDCSAGRATDVESGFMALNPNPGVIEYELRGLGAFPDVRRANVIWCGIQADPAKMQAVFSMIERFTVSLGFPPETRGFTPHLTLARVRKGMKIPSPVETYLLENSSTGYGRSVFRNITLYSSQLTPRGSVYRALHEITLPGK